MNNKETIIADEMIKSLEEYEYTPFNLFESDTNPVDHCYNFRVYLTRGEYFRSFKIKENEFNEVIKKLKDKFYILKIPYGISFVGKTFRLEIIKDNLEYYSNILSSVILNFRIINSDGEECGKFKYVDNLENDNFFIEIGEDMNEVNLLRALGIYKNRDLTGYLFKKYYDKLPVEYKLKFELMKEGI